MNISGLVRSFLGEAQPTAAKTLELKAGQVVKGIVLQLLSEQDALVNINGVQVRAKLETPLAQGQITLLQVQPDSVGGQIVLKPLAGSGVQITAHSLGDVLDTLGLEDNAANRQLVQALHQSDVPISKENIQAFARLHSQIPVFGGQDEWVPSAIVAFQRGIPLTADAVSSIRQATSGPPLHTTLARLDMQINSLLAAGALSDDARSAAGAAKQVIALVRQASAQILLQPEAAAHASAEGAGPQVASCGGAGIAAQAGRESGGGEAAAVGSSSLEQTPQPGRSPSAPGGAPHAQTAALSSLRPNANPAAAEGSRATAEAAQRGLAAAQSSGSTPAARKAAAPAPDAGPRNPEPAAQPARALPAQPHSAAPDGAAAHAARDTPPLPDAQRAEPGGGLPAAHAATPQAAAEASGHAVAGAAAGRAGQAADTREHWLPQILKALGVAHEHHIAKLPDLSPLGTAVRDGMPSSLVASTGQSVNATQEQNDTSQTLKSALLQLIHSDDVPSVLKDTAQQAVQQITGQQLLLNSDRSAMFAHITLLVPLINSYGEQTAAIHIQSRKGARGELDAHNCRLVFDLRMKTLGDTMVDVQAVDRIVSLRVLNDQPFIADLLEPHREEIAASLASVGYQFISLKCSPYPDKGKTAHDATLSETVGTHANLSGQQLQTAYGQQQYRGMDVRI
ncbi:hypothetical protein [Paenibacillus xerothermodurans]|uniref:Flagellar hook-length control protein FliK n=1 Tax=Paenibacillus xerothermodurans TaxID=1977292 RepID=A0A2W1P425_PAEXE|nr:hypothetical protein [Paenibacillus xerothermodurans]PZE22472.1 hypothetical protein CBW46_001415 [Paenibacillus xerothermodurans]